MNKDQADKAMQEAEELLPCAWKNINDSMCSGEGKCGACRMRPAVAAKLRERDWTISEMEQNYKNLESQLAAANSEIEKLKTANQAQCEQILRLCEIDARELDEYRELKSQLTAANSEVEGLKKERDYFIAKTVPKPDKMLDQLEELKSK